MHADDCKRVFMNIYIISIFLSVITDHEPMNQ